MGHLCLTILSFLWFSGMMANGQRTRVLQRTPKVVQALLLGRDFVLVVTCWQHSLHVICILFLPNFLGRAVDTSI